MGEGNRKRRPRLVTVFTIDKIYGEPRRRKRHRLVRKSAPKHKR